MLIGKIKTVQLYPRSLHYIIYIVLFYNYCSENAGGIKTVQLYPRLFHYIIQCCFITIVPKMLVDDPCSHMFFRCCQLSQYSQSQAYNLDMLFQFHNTWEHGSFQFFFLILVERSCSVSISPQSIIRLYIHTACWIVQRYIKWVFQCFSLTS